MLSKEEFQLLKSHQYCDNPDCPCFRLESAGNIRIHSSSKNQVYCKVCKNLWVVTKGTFLFGLKTPVKKVIYTLQLMAEGMGLRKACRQQGITPSTANMWIERATEHAEDFTTYMQEEMKVEQHQIDQFWEFINAKKKVR